MIKKLVLIFAVAGIVCSCTEKNNTGTKGSLETISLKDVTISDGFWGPRIDNNRLVSVPLMLDRYEEQKDPNSKLTEACAYILQTNPDPEFRKRTEENYNGLINYYIPNGKVREWKRMLNGDLYGAGHFIEASVAYYQATGDEKALDAATRVADDIHDRFNPEARQEISQHEEVKIGLLRLYELTRDDKYLETAKFFLDERGYSHNGRELYGEYAQDHKPVIEQEEATGHAVRATYLYTPLAHLATLTGDPEYINASDKIWENAVNKKTYIVGHVGSYRDHECFGDNYELPNVNCWNETCSAVGNVFWNYRMFELHRESKYIDMMEKILYNAVISGVSLDGKKYFYQNPLKSVGDVERNPWYGPNCCPPNVARLLASLGKYIYARSGNDLFVNLFIGSKLETSIDNTKMTVKQETAYPWNGKIKLGVNPEKNVEFTLNIRIPGWTRSPMSGDLYSYTDNNNIPVIIKLNGKIIKYRKNKGYAVIKRKWGMNDVVEIEMDMPVRKVVSNELVKENSGMMAIQRGPLVYCAEGVDNDSNVFNLLLSSDAEFETVLNDELPGGLLSLTANVKAIGRGPGKDNITEAEHTLVAIPYFSWANREVSEMSVWLAADISRVIIPPAPSIASKAVASSSCGSGSPVDNYPGHTMPILARRFYPNSQAGDIGFKALSDQVKPVSSFDGSSTYLRLRPQEGDEAWVQYDFDSEYTISEAGVYWKDDKQNCPVPASWDLEYLAGNKWQPVHNTTDYTTEKDMYNTVKFEPVQATALRMNIKLTGLQFKKGELGPPDGNYMPENTTWYECGIIEWSVK